MPAQFSTNTVAWSENTDTVVVKRYNKTGPQWTTTIIYSGVCDFQDGSGSIRYNEAGVAVQDDAQCFLDGKVGVMVDDELVFNGDSTLTFVVMSASQWSLTPVHTEISLKRGGIAYEGTT